MFRLLPKLEIPPRQCPHCLTALIAEGFLIPGMRNLADLKCPRCHAEFYADLPVGQGLFTPFLLDKKSGAVSGDFNAGWFADSLKNSYANRTDEPLKFETRKFADTKNKVIFLNCLDVLYGHSLLKLLNAQYYLDFHKDKSLIVLVPRFLEWLLPDGISEAWSVDLPLRRGTEWNDWLAGEIGQKLASYAEVFLSVAFSHPHNQDFEIERFTYVVPFNLEDFAKIDNRPVITFVWRDDRLWETPENSNPTNLGKIKNRLGFVPSPLEKQTGKIVEFAEHLRRQFPKLDFAVAGFGQSGGLPEWIANLRLTKVDEKTERDWCRRYAASHLVVGVHGSNMLLPSAHAGGVIELIGEDRWGNYLQDILFRRADTRESMFLNRFVPHSTAPEDLAKLAATMLRFDDFRRLMSPEFCRHQEKYDFSQFLSGKREKTSESGE